MTGLAEAEGKPGLAVEQLGHPISLCLQTGSISFYLLALVGYSKQNRSNRAGASPVVFGEDMPQMELDGRLTSSGLVLQGL